VLLDGLPIACCGGFVKHLLMLTGGVLRICSVPDFAVAHKSLTLLSGILCLSQRFYDHYSDDSNVQFHLVA